MIEEYRMSLEQKLGMLISGFRTDLPLYVGAGELQSNIIDLTPISSYLEIKHKILSAIGKC
jgi:hypothetical protein